MADDKKNLKQPHFSDAAHAYLQLNTLAMGMREGDRSAVGLRPPTCEKLGQWVDDPKHYESRAYPYDWQALPCVTWVLMKLAAPYRHDDFSPTAPMDDIWARLDLRSHPLVPRHLAWQEHKEPIYLPGHPEKERDIDVVRGPRSAEITIQVDDRRQWRRYIYYLGRADWTGDGRADLLYGWIESDAPGIFDTDSILVLTTDGPNRPIRVIAQIDWMLENRERARALLYGLPSDE